MLLWYLPVLCPSAVVWGKHDLSQFEINIVWDIYMRLCPVWKIVKLIGLYMKILKRISITQRLHLFETMCPVAYWSDPTHPWVVEAVTDTTMMVAWVRYCCNASLFLALSKSLPSSRTVIMYSCGCITSDSNSGNLFEYLSLTNRWIRTGRKNIYKLIFVRTKLFFKTCIVRSLFLFVNNKPTAKAMN